MSSSDQGLKMMAPIVTGRPSFSDAIFCTCDLRSGGTASQASAQSTSSATTSKAARNSQMCQLEERSVAEDFVEGAETVESAALAARAFVCIGIKFSLIDAKDLRINCKMCDAICAAKSKKPRPNKLVGADGGRKYPCRRGFAKERVIVSQCGESK